jgi:hypothetical protein
MRICGKKSETQNRNYQEQEQDNIREITGRTGKHSKPTGCHFDAQNCMPFFALISSCATTRINKNPARFPGRALMQTLQYAVFTTRNVS